MEPEDHLIYAKDPEIINKIGNEKICYSGKIEKMKFGLFNKFHGRNLLITNVAIYNFKKKEIKRRIKIEDLIGITYSRQSNEFVLHFNDNNYDFLFKSENRNKIILILENLYEKIKSKDLLFSAKIDKDLSKYVVTKKERKNSPYLFKLDKNDLTPIKEYLENETGNKNHGNNNIDDFEIISFPPKEEQEQKQETTKFTPPNPESTSQNSPKIEKETMVKVISGTSKDIPPPPPPPPPPPVIPTKIKPSSSKISVQKNNNDKPKKTEKKNINELKICLYPDREPRYEFKKKSLSLIISKDTLAHSFMKNQKLAYINSRVPVLNGFYLAHENHYPIRIKPDDIWLLIVQAFSNHVNNNAEALRNKFVNFQGKKDLIVNYPIKNIKEVNKEILSDFSVEINAQMKGYLGEELLNILTPDFTTTDEEKVIIFKITIMGAFKKYFNYIMGLCGCGIPYLILEGTSEDYEKIYSKTKELSKYDFSWYVDRVLPIIQKFIDSKKGNVDVEFFKNIVQDNQITEYHSVPSGKGYYTKIPGIKGWILNFFAYYSSGKKFDGKQIKIKHFENLCTQMLEVPFIIDASGKQHSMKYSVGFLGCDKNDENEVFPVTGWVVSLESDKSISNNYKKIDSDGDNDEELNYTFEPKGNNRNFRHDEDDEESEEDDWD